MVTRIIQRLEEHDYIKVISGNDRCGKRIQLTEVGENTYEEVLVTIEAFQKEA